MDKQHVRGTDEVKRLKKIVKRQTAEKEQLVKAVSAMEHDCHSVPLDYIRTEGEKLFLPSPPRGADKDPNAWAYYKECLEKHGLLSLLFYLFYFNVLYTVFFNFYLKPDFCFCFIGNLP